MKSVRLLLGILLIVAVVYLSWKVVPAYFANYQFQEDVDDVARTSAMNMRKAPEDIKAMVLQKARSREIPVDAEDIIVTRNGADVSISAQYTVHVDVPVYPFDLNFNASTKREGLTFR